MRYLVPAAGVLLALAVTSSAQTVVQPTTTLSTENGNNTSTSDTFAGLANGTPAAGNVSKEPIGSLLYPGATTKVYAHYMPWFGKINHMDVGYNSTDPAQVRRQVEDMASRGFAGAIVDWYGEASTHANESTRLLFLEAAARPGFEVALNVDGGALKPCVATAGCDVTQLLIQELDYAYANYITAPAYMRYQGRPVIIFFGAEAFAVDWDKVRAAVQGDPLFVFRRQDAVKNGFTRPQSDGAFAWSNATSDGADLRLQELDAFYGEALTQYPDKLPIGAVYPGFNDALAAWAPSLPRKINQRCGLTWLDTFARLRNFYSPERQLDFLQVVTWNDIEEGSSIESGIENCLAIEADVNDGALAWSITGNEETVAYYRVFISPDGDGLMPLRDVPVGAERRLALDELGFAPANYLLFVQAIGRPSITNKMSAGVAYNPANKAPVVALSVSPSTAEPGAEVVVSIAGTTDPEGGAFTASINFGDGAVADGPEASHAYATAGAYTVTASVTDDQGLTAVKKAYIKVAYADTPEAVLSVTPTSGLAPLTVTASTAGSSRPAGSTTTIDFGNGVIETADAASHTYSLPGAYTVSAQITATSGATSSASQLVTVAGVRVSQPLSGATVTSPVRFVAAGYAPAPITAMKIYVDGVSAYTIYHNKLDTIITLTDGTRNVTVQAWDGTGVVYKTALKLTVVQPVNVPPTADLVVTPTSGTAPLSVQVSLLNVADSDGTVTGTSINFGNGAVVSGASGSVTYTAAGTYTITGKVTDNRGATTTRTQTVTVNPGNQPPVARLTVTPLSGSAPLNVSASATASSDPDGTIASGSIDFGNGVVVQGLTGSAKYSKAGTYIVKATVVDNSGAASSASAAVTVYGVSILSPAGGSTVSSPVTVAASAKSSRPITTMKVYVDGAVKYSTSAGLFSTALAMARGTRRITVKAWDSGGKVYSEVVTVTVR